MTMKTHKPKELAAKQRLFACLLVVFACVSFGAPATSQSLIAGTASVIDADTIEIHGARIRLHAVDAIESGQKCLLPGGKEWRCGTDAANALAKKIGRSSLKCQVYDKDRYGRFVAKCFQKGEDMSAFMCNMCAHWS